MEPHHGSLAEYVRGLTQQVEALLLQMRTHAETQEYLTQRLQDLHDSVTAVTHTLCGDQRDITKSVLYRLAEFERWRTDHVSAESQRLGDWRRVGFKVVEWAIIAAVGALGVLIFGGKNPLKP
jgi:hypothetical protein